MCWEPSGLRKRNRRGNPRLKKLIILHRARKLYVARAPRSQAHRAPRTEITCRARTAFASSSRTAHVNYSPDLTDSGGSIPKYSARASR